LIEAPPGEKYPSNLIRIMPAQGSVSQWCFFLALRSLRVFAQGAP